MENENNANREPTLEEIEANLLSGVELSNMLINHFEKLRIESSTRFEDVGYSASDQLVAATSHQVRYAPVFYSLKAAYLSCS